jgi:hypothetical protein
MPLILPLRHSRVSGMAQGPDPEQIQPADWNAELVAASAGVLQTRINNASAGDVVDLTGMTYAITSTVTINKALTLRGCKVTTSSNIAMIAIGANDVTLDNVWLVGPSSSVYNGNSVGVLCEGVPTANRFRLRIFDSRFEALAYGGIRMRHVSDFEIRRNWVRDCIYMGIQGLSVHDGEITDNRVQRIGPGTDGNAYGIAVSFLSPGDANSDDVFIARNLVEDVTVWEAIDTHSGQRITFAYNFVRRSRRGVMITTGNGASSDCVVSCNTFIDPKANVAGDERAIVLVGCNDTIVANNVIKGWGTPDAEHAVNQNSDTNSTISGNVIDQS